MRYLELSMDFPPDPMFGAGIHVGDLVQGLSETGDTALVATRETDGPAERTLHDGRVKVVNAMAQHDSGNYRTPSDTAWFLPERLAYNHALLAAVDADDSGFDVVHNHEPVMVPLACELAESHQVPMVTTVHIPDVALAGSGVPRPRWLDRHVARALEVEGYRRSDLILAPSRATAQLLAAEYPWCAERITVLELPHPGSPVGKESYRIDGPARVLVVSRLDPNKGLVSLIEALGLLPSGTVACEVIGAGGMRGKLAEVAERAGVDVTFRGKLPRAEVLDSYRSADVFIAPSPLETYGLVLQEAMAAGMPVIATDIPAFAERVSDGVNGLLVPVEDGVGPMPAELAAKISRLIGSQALRRDLGQAAGRRRTASITDYAAELGRLIRRLT